MKRLKNGLNITKKQPVQPSLNNLFKQINLTEENKRIVVKNGHHIRIIPVQEII